MSSDNQASILDAAKREKDYIKTRNGSLIMLAFGTAVACALIGENMGRQFTDKSFFILLTQIFCVVFGYISIDAIVRNNLLASSSGNGNKDLSDYFKRKSIISLIFTVLFSVGASWFIGQYTKGESHLPKLNETIIGFSKRDSTNKVLASTTLKNLSKSEQKALSFAIAKSKQLEKDVVRKGSTSWREDYRKAKNNPNHWLWTCTGKKSGCPKNYRNWRDNILSAREEGKMLIANSGGSNTKLVKSLSSVFDYSLSGDSTLITLQQNINTLESERNMGGNLITFLMVLITIVAALGAYSSNGSLNKIRSVYGRQIQEGDQLIFDVFEDFIIRIVAQVLSIVYGVLQLIDKGLNKIGIDLYEIKPRPIAKIISDLKGEEESVKKAPHATTQIIKQNPVSQNLIVEEKEITTTMPIEFLKSPTLPVVENTPTHVGTDVEAVVIENPTTVEVPKKKPVEAKKEDTFTTDSTPVATVVNKPTTVGATVEPTINVVVNQGLPFVMWNEVKRDKAWVKKNLAAYAAKKVKKIEKGNSHETEDKRIGQLSTVLSQLIENTTVG